MRKIEVAVPKGKGKWIAHRAEKAGATDVIILESHGPGQNRELVTITAKADKVDAIINSIADYEDKKNIKPDIRIWKTEEPFTQVEKEGKEQTTVPFEELKAHAYESAEIDLTYLLLCVLSGLLAAFGLLQNSAIVVIGAMIIAPLLRPITTSALGTVTGDVIMFWKGASALVFGLFLAIITVFFSMFLFPGMQPTALTTTISQLNMLTLGVAFIAGIIAAVSLMTDLSETLAGVAIAVSLMPPAAAASINVFFAVFGIVDMSIAASTLLVLLVNIISIDIGSAVVFYAYGVTPVSQEKKFFSTHLKVAAAMLLLLSIPFAYTSIVSYQHTQDQNIITNVLNNEARSVAGYVESLEVSFDPLTINVKIVSPVSAPPDYRSRVESNLESSLQKDVLLLITYIKSEPL